MSCWNPPENAPKDMSAFLGDFGMPWLCPTVWNAAEDRWCIAVLQCGLFKGNWNDTYFESDHMPEDELKGWMPLPAFEAE